MSRHPANMSLRTGMIVVTGASKTRYHRYLPEYVLSRGVRFGILYKISVNTGRLSVLIGDGSIVQRPDAQAVSSICVPTEDMNMLAMRYAERKQANPSLPDIIKHPSYDIFDDSIRERYAVLEDAIREKGI